MISAAPQQRAPSFYLSPQQLQMLHFLQQNLNSLTPQQQAALVQLQHQYRMMQQHQQQLRQQAGQRGLRPGQPGYPTAFSHPQNLGQSSGVVKNYGIPQQPVNIVYLILNVRQLIFTRKNYITWHFNSHIKCDMCVTSKIDAPFNHLN